jgi:hypothetical protein
MRVRDGELIDIINDGTVFDVIVGDPNSDFRTEKAKKSKLLVVSFDVVPGSRNVDHEKMVKLIESKGFRVPITREAVIMILVWNIEPSKKGEGYFFGVEGGKYPTCIATDTFFEERRLYAGCATSSGLGVHNGYLRDVIDRGIGMAAVVDVFDFLDDKSLDH